MMPGSRPALATLLSVALISAVPLAALLVASNRPFLRRLIAPMVSVAAGAMLGSACLELIPESFARLAHRLEGPGLMLAGFLAFFVADRIVWRRGQPDAPVRVHPVVILNFIGVVSHNAIDGMVIAASFLVSTPLGISTAMAVFLHEIPHELGDFGIFVHGGLLPRHAAWLNFLTAAGAFAGAGVMLAMAARAAGWINVVMAFAAGNFFYIAASNLIPGLPRETRWTSALRQVALVGGGVLVVALPTLLGAGG